MIDVTSYSFLIPLVLAGYVVAWAISRTRLATPTKRLSRPSSVEVTLSMILIALSVIGYLVIYVALADLFQSIVQYRTVAYYLFFVLVPIVLVLRFLRRRFDYVRLTAHNWLFSVVSGGCPSLILLVSTAIAAPFFVDIMLDPYVLEIATGLSPIIFVVTITLSAFGEELLFRGLLQSRLEGFLGAKSGVLMTALVFEVWHFPLYVLVPPQLTLARAVGIAIGSFPLSVLLGYLAHRSDNILGANLLHISYNLPIWVLATSFP